MLLCIGQELPTLAGGISEIVEKITIVTIASRRQLRKRKIRAVDTTLQH
jgi:hypothetical protein